MASYTLRHLLMSDDKLSVTVFEAAAGAGCGMPYRAGMNADEMYCNAFSREIPVFSMHLSTWLKGQTDAFLQDWGLNRGDIDTRSFYPRVLLGHYLADEFATLCDKGRADGHDISVFTNHRVVDIRPTGPETICICDTGNGIVTATFDDVIIATGHTWPRHPQIDGIPLISPWPFTNMTALPPKNLGILGASLSAIDAVIAIAHHHGAFTETGAQLTWHPENGAEDLRITMVSHNGIMPEPDFHHVFPYEPLRYITDEAVAQEIAAGSDRLLQRVFDLLIREIKHAAPDYLPSLGEGAETIQGFGTNYARQRKELGGLRALAASLQTAVASFQTQTTLPHRYAMLRGHESFEAVLERLNTADTEIFRKYLAPVFADCYAAIPHISVQRVLALYNAGVLDLRPTAQGAAFSNGPDGVCVQTIDGPICFDAMIDARGQSPAALDALPFPSLVRALADPDADLVSPYLLRLLPDLGARIHCLAMPQILMRNSFAQGLANCEAIASVAVQNMLAVQPQKHSQLLEQV